MENKMEENIITSIANERIKEIKKLYDKKYRRLNQKYIIEGIKITEEAYIQNQIFDKIILYSIMFFPIFFAYLYALL